MALTATRMTGTAVFVFGLQDFVKNRVVFLVGPSLDNLGEWSQSVVEAIFSCRSNLVVAFSAGLVCRGEGGVLDYFPVGSLPVTINRVPTMASLAVYLSMLGFQKGWVYKDLLIQLQRSQRSSSSFSRRLS